jgi:hypothetical protein
MNVDFMLPRPTEDELNLGAKSDYYQRIYELDYEKMYKITSQELSNWIHHNYSAVFLLGEELSYKEFKKLK